MKKLLTALLVLVLSSCTKAIEELPIHKIKPKDKVTPTVISTIGDSMSSDDLGNISMTGVTSSKSYSWFLKQSLDSTTHSFRNWAVSGVGIAQMTAQAQSIIAETDLKKNNIVLVLGCINNITFNGMSGTECYNQMSALHKSLRAKGLKTVAIALTSRRQLSYFSEEQSKYFWTQITTADSLLKANAKSYCDYYLDLQEVPGFAGYEAATTSSYFLDGVHWSLEGRAKVAELLKPVIAKL